MTNSSTLAAEGGTPVFSGEWPEWPRSDGRSETLVLEALRSGRWAISGAYTGVESFERRFAAAFAAFHDVAHCVPTSSGTSALTIALQSLDVGPGDEVLVPGLTWVACASAVLALGAVPVLVDVEADTLCMDLDHARERISERTRAILLVHLYCAVADLDGFLALAEETGISLIEDCAQAHGASWRGRRVGTFGHIGAFSMQQGKVLTSGEGGAVITSDDRLHDRLQQLRADGRRYLQTPPPVGWSELEETGSVVGANRCLSEPQAALLLAGLERLEDENQRREAAGRWLGEELERRGLATLLRRREPVDRRTYYRFCVRLPEDIAGDRAAIFARALSAELGLRVESTYVPLDRHPLYRPQRSPLVARSDRPERFSPRPGSLPEAERAWSQCVALPHRVLLAGPPALEAVVEAFDKVSARRHRLADLPSGTVGAAHPSFTGGCA